MRAWPSLICSPYSSNLGRGRNDNPYEICTGCSVFKQFTSLPQAMGVGKNYSILRAYHRGSNRRFCYDSTWLDWRTQQTELALDIGHVAFLTIPTQDTLRAHYRGSFRTSSQITSSSLKPYKKMMPWLSVTDYYLVSLSFLLLSTLLPYFQHSVKPLWDRPWQDHLLYCVSEKRRIRRFYPSLLDERSRSRPLLPRAALSLCIPGAAAGLQDSTENW